MTLSAALAPVLLLSAVSAYLNAQKGIGDRRERLLLLADSAVDGVEQSLSQAELFLKLYGPDIIDGKCKQVFDRLGPIVLPLSNVTRFDRDGISTCSAIGEPGFEITNPSWLAQLSRDVPVVRTNSFYGPVSKDWLFAILARVETQDGEFDGAVSFALRSDELAKLVYDGAIPVGVEVALVDEQGKAYGSDRFQQLPADWIAMSKSSAGALIFLKQGEQGSRYDVALIPIGDSNVYAAISRATPGFWNELTLEPMASFGLPLLTFGITLFALWFALDKLVLRWFSRIERVARVYGGGHYAFKSSGQFAGAPEEIAEMALSLDQMATDIQDRDNRLRAAIETRDAAVKEIHHRVKNNLQIVTSFLNLQARQLKDPDAREALSDARNRINALAIVHQSLYQHERLEVVSLKPFLSSLAAHLVEGLGLDELKIRLTSEFDDIERPADDAIPIALFLVEAITNAAKFAFGASGGSIDVRLASTPNGIELSVSDDGKGRAKGGASDDGLGSRLIQAFARQLGATSSIDTAPGKGYRLVLLLPTESRHAKPQA